MSNINLTNSPQTIVTENNPDIKFQNQLQSLISSFELKLTASQQKAITKLWQFIHSPNHFFLLAGYAGYLIQEINNKQQQQRYIFFTQCNYNLLHNFVYTA